MQIKLSWLDPVTRESRQSTFAIPVALGKKIASMPQIIEGKRVSRLVLQDEEIADYHALIYIENGELQVLDSSTTGIKVNDKQIFRSKLTNGDHLQICSYEITISSETEQCDRMVGFLFKRKCDRTSKNGCLDCNDDGLYTYQEYGYYPNYGNYSRGYWGADYYYERDRYFYDPATGNVDFTEADNVSLEAEGDEDFELDMGAS